VSERRDGKGRGEVRVSAGTSGDIPQQTNLVRRRIGPLDGLLLLNRRSVLALLDTNRHLIRRDFELSGCLDGVGFGCEYEYEKGGRHSFGGVWRERE
jgi:hypothetical protein